MGVVPDICATSRHSFMARKLLGLPLPMELGRVPRLLQIYAISQTTPASDRNGNRCWVQNPHQVMW